MSESLLKILTYLFGGLMAILIPNIPFMAILLFVMMLDITSAFRLNRRLYKLDPCKYKKAHFSSEKFFKSVWSFGYMCLLIIAAHLVGIHIFPFMVACSFTLAHIVAGAMIFGNVLSILENETTGSDEKWAKILQKIIKSKADRYLKDKFDVDISEFLNETKCE